MWHQTLVHPTQICRHPNKLHVKKEKPCFVIVGIRPWYTPRRQPNKLHAKKKKPCFGIMGVRPLYNPHRPTDTQTNCMRERKKKTVHHGFHNKEAYPLLQDHGHETLVHPTQTCRHPNQSPERKGKPALHGFNNRLSLQIFIRDSKVKNEIGYRTDVTMGHESNFIPLFSYAVWTVVLCLTTP